MSDLLRRIWARRSSPRRAGGGMWTVLVEANTARAFAPQLSTTRGRDGQRGEVTIETAKHLLASPTPPDMRRAPGHMLMIRGQRQWQRGMRREVRRRRSSHFFTTRRPGKAQGSGGRRSWLIKQSAALRVYSEPGQGTTVRLTYRAISGCGDSRLARIAAGGSGPRADDPLRGRRC